MSDDEGRTSQHRAHNLPLHPNTAAVNDAQRSQTQAVCFLKISFHHIRNLLRLYSVQVKDVGDGNTDRFLLHDGFDPNVESRRHIPGPNQSCGDGLAPHDQETC